MEHDVQQSQFFFKSTPSVNAQQPFNQISNYFEIEQEEMPIIIRELLSAPLQAHNSISYLVLTNFYTPIAWSVKTASFHDYFVESMSHYSS